MKKLSALVLGLCALVCRADDVVVGLHVATHHFSERQGPQGWNNVNPGLYLRYGHAVVGFYRNSEFRQSEYVAGVVEHGISDRVSIAVMAGVVTGYAKKIRPLGLASIAYAVSDTFSVRLSAAPKAHQKGSALLHLSLERSFK